MTFIVTFLYLFLPAILHFCNFIVGFILSKVMFLHNPEHTVWLGYFTIVVSQITSIYASFHLFIFLCWDFNVVFFYYDHTLELTSNSMNFQVFKVIRRQDWYRPDAFLYKDLIIALAKCQKMDDAMQLWEDMRKENLFPDSQTYTEMIRGFLRHGSPADAMNVYEDMTKSPEPPEELPFRILLKGLLPHPLLRNRVKQDFEELFPERHVYDPPEEIFGLRWGLHLVFPPFFGS